MRWDELTSDLFPEAVQQSEGVCLLPLSCIERHGPHLPLATDMFIGREVCNRAAALEPAIVFPDYIFTQILEARHYPGCIGIEPEFLPHVFDRFRQADSSSTRRYSGLGLGLAIVRYLAEAHGGTVSAYSPGKGQGSMFRVTFPLAEMPGSAQLGSGPLKPEYKALFDGRTASLEKLHGLRVLVVDDDPETLDMLKFLLTQCGAEVTTATSVREAVQVLEHSRINVLVSDLAMPDEDGYDLIRQVRKRARGNMPAIALSAYTGSEDRERALAAGFQLHLAKPIAPAELVSALGSFRKAA